ncbi:hypothetical protein KSP40_PGU000295 [Platanthera guangdongensis]|uniref:Uncharacterized protein n=1 Tax=Platanthera guangdongensis TaxID=2320717 RepID=A0ABR2LWD7_9ASPA
MKQGGYCRILLVLEEGSGGAARLLEKSSTMKDWVLLRLNFEQESETAVQQLAEKLLSELLKKLDSELKHEVCHWAAYYEII